MSVIKILSDQEAKKIAAGEVVERPASVVKELIENSLDAQATHISLYIEKAGKKLIRVVDNGCGMGDEDAKKCFVNHATSKITSLDDLQSLNSFGFRGEALASISSVSNVSLQTKVVHSDTGVLLSYQDGDFKDEKTVACAPGTDLKIHDLFYNTPVRQKFLKQDETEWNQIQSLFQAFCLSNLHIHFKLYRDDRLILNAPPVSDLKDRVLQIWGHNMSQNINDLVFEAHNSKDVTISGLLSNHTFWRYGRQQIFFFVNKRWVKNSDLSKALLKGYRNVLPPARFPAAFIFITTSHEMVDINVHPRKEEVRFAKPVTIHNLLHKAVTRTLEKGITQQLQHVSMQDITSSNNDSRETFVEAEQVVEDKGDVERSSTMAFSSPWSGVVQKEGRSEIGVALIKKPVALKNEEVLQQEFLSREDNVKSSGKIIGQLLQTYIVVENKDGLLLIDQHAAHERILYEKYLKNFEQKDGTRLLFPEVIKLTEVQLKYVLREQEFLKKQGIEVGQISNDSIALKTSPPKIESSSLRELIFEMIEFIEEHEALEEEVFRKKLNEHMHGQMACKMAVKAGDVLTETTMYNIVNELQEVDNRFICVHGRPTTWSISKHDIEKKFRRK